ncbi:MAG: hypothetical protein K0S33_638 [Bacteroidetes bacterium]|jgi:hypothetical protein|nr:hypothetical protein [Bacteroidota bacterium]
MLESLTKHGNVVKKLKNTSYLLFLSCLAMEGINYKHMWWAHIMGNGGSFVEFYNYKFPHRTSPGKLRKENFSANSAVFIGKEENGYLYELLMTRHVTNTFMFWVNTDTTSTNTIVFYGVSESKAVKDADLINGNFGIVSRCYYLHRFEKAVLNTYKWQGKRVRTPVVDKSWLIKPPDSYQEVHRAKAFKLIDSIEGLKAHAMST